MSKMVQIRNVPDALHRKLKSRAADSGQSYRLNDQTENKHDARAYRSRLTFLRRALKRGSERSVSKHGVVSNPRHQLRVCGVGLLQAVERSGSIAESQLDEG
jgi:hypothetical protein